MFKMSAMRLVSMMLLLGFFVQPSALAADAQSKQRRGRADTYMQAATLLVRQSQGMLKSTPDRDTVKTALALFTSAGQIFELAAFDYKQLVSVGAANPGDIEAAVNGKKICVDSIRQINANIRPTRG